MNLSLKLLKRQSINHDPRPVKTQQAIIMLTNFGNKIKQLRLFDFYYD